MKSEGHCDSYITTREECEQAARKIDREAACREWGGSEVCKWSNTTIGKTYTQHDHPPGCYLIWDPKPPRVLRVLAWNTFSYAQQYEYAGISLCRRWTECICRSTPAAPTTAPAGEYNTGKNVARTKRVLTIWGKYEEAVADQNHQESES